MRKFVVTLLTAALVLLGIAPASAYPGQGATWDAGEPHSSILIIGDSFVMQGGPTAVALAEQRDHQAEAWAISGGAACDFVGEYGTRAEGIGNLTDVAIAFVGNATSACMESALGDPPAVLNTTQVNAIVARYRLYLTNIVNWNQARGIATYLIAAPVMAAGTWHGQVTNAYNAMLIDLAADENTATQRVRYTQSARRLLSPNGTFTETLAGLQIRHPSDGTHLYAPYGTTLWGTGVLSGPLTGNG